MDHVYMTVQVVDEWGHQVFTTDIWINATESDDTNGRLAIEQAFIETEGSRP